MIVSQLLVVSCLMYIYFQLVKEHLLYTWSHGMLTFLSFSSYERIMGRYSREITHYPYNIILSLFNTLYITLYFILFFRKNTGLETCFTVFGYQIFSWKGSRMMGSGRSFVLMKLQVWQIAGVQILRGFTVSMRTR